MALMGLRSCLGHCFLHEAAQPALTARHAWWVQSQSPRIQRCILCPLSSLASACSITLAPVSRMCPEIEKKFTSEETNVEVMHALHMLMDALTRTHPASTAYLPT